MPSTFLVLGPNSCCSSYWKLSPGEKSRPHSSKPPAPGGAGTSGGRGGAEPERDGARTAAPGPAEGAAASPAGLRGCGARVPACASRGGLDGERASPPARPRGPRRPHLSGQARGVRGALRGPRFAAPLSHPAPPLLFVPARRPEGRPLHPWGGFSLWVRAPPPPPRSEPGRCRRGVSAGRERAWAGGGGDRARGAPLPPPPAPPLPPASPRKFVAPPPPSADLRGRLAGSRPVAKEENSSWRRRRRAGSRSAMSLSIRAAWLPGHLPRLFPTQVSGISSAPSVWVWRGPGAGALGPCAEPGSARCGGAGRRGVDLGFSAIRALALSSLHHLLRLRFFLQLLRHLRVLSG